MKQAPIKRALALLSSFVLCSCGNLIVPKYGVQDDVAASAIRRINGIAELRSTQRYQGLVTQLEADYQKFGRSAYAQPRILNELADIYSLQTLDIESAIQADEQLIRSDIPAADTTGDFLPRYQTASQYTIADSQYVTKYVSVDAATIKKSATDRLQTNRQLLAGNRPNTSKTYAADKLQQHIKQVQNDIDSTPPGSAARKRILSRLIRGEYELSKISSKATLAAYRFIDKGDMSSDGVDLSEIDFLSLADYYIQVFRRTGNIVYAEYALDTVYRPYSNLRNPSFRWRYNKLINDYISTLIEANFQAENFDEVLYYVSLNKSRLLLEERLAYTRDSGNAMAKVADLASEDGIPRTPSGLPQKSWYRQRLAQSGPYLDLYVGGKFMPLAANKNIRAAKAERSTMPLTTRDFGIDDAALASDSFVDDALYATRIDSGRVISVKKLSGNELANLKNELNRSYDQISQNKDKPGDAAAFFRKISSTNPMPERLTVSPDKWVLRHPIDFHLGAKVTRSVNFFTTGDARQLRDIRVSGFFNPTLDLQGAEQEAEAIRQYVPSAQVFKREAANLQALQSASDATVVHLSMHGQFNADDPKDSRLAFNGAIRGRSVTTDPNSLYARDMHKYAALKGRDLVFAAACQAGLSAADQANENELMGILRPLTANRNRNIILSLWNVDDIATRDFVAAFYQQLAQTHDIVTAFHHAQDEVRKKYPHPYYWASFYLAQAR
ncbi:CHAT domain-containing protein [Dechloromonas sp. TW-R-39-2]|uniref:CHAT domain-containing protein n=1 Tax=Dechloromonas sp. TW-R-39-2 TaxID=2654218 RepID=UPI00193E5941|nr:CHAT domain-containing protein [Dechloromonas sp. TW-R-39-2]QRM18186.1 CHAT domain-containing protein [Dechloromonas sp. TW-R-39-2]